MVAGKTAVVTGGGQGIGKAVSRSLLEAGYSVVIAEIDEEVGEQAEVELGGLGPVLFVPCDVADESAVSRLIGQASSHFGGMSALVNNAATSANKPLEELSLMEWNRVLAVNLTGPMLLVRHAAPKLKAAGGAVVNIASTRALMSERDTEAYSASKGGLVALTHALAMSLAPEVRVNCVSPGWIEVREGSQLRDEDHAQHPVGRVGKAEDIAALVRYLLGPEASFITGQNFVVDGGMTKKMIYL
jgi:NAD(P)-dependent dehydrogenase (short-subunit alcohol dehydrogenase family)